MIQNNAVRLEHFVRDLLITARAAGEEVAILKETILVREFIFNTVEAYRPLVEAKRISLKAECDADLEVEADAAKLHQILSNILSNAVKFSQSGEIVISATNKNGHAVFQVRDQGSGIPKKDLERVFERFYQAKNNKQAKGTGIGLTIAKAWVEAHGGKIWAESEGLGKGTKVSFTVPVQIR